MCVFLGSHLVQEHLHLMGIPVFPEHSDPSDPCPVFTYNPPATVKKRLAGNVSRLQCNASIMFSLQCKSSSLITSHHR